MATHNILLERLAERVRELEADHYRQPDDNRFKANDIILVHRSCYEEQGVLTGGLSLDDDGNIESKCMSAVFGGVGWSYEACEDKDSGRWI